MTRHCSFIVLAVTATAVCSASFAQPFPTSPAYSPTQPGSGDPYFPGESRYPLPSELPPRRDPFDRQPPRSNDERIGRGQTRADQPANKPDLYEPAQIVAWVGDQPIMLGDLLGQVNQALAPYAAKMTKTEFDIQREKLIKQALESAIDTKLLYVQFLRKLPDRKRLKEIEERIVEAFEKKQMPVLMTSADVKTPGELDLYLRRYGSSIEKMKQAFIEQAIASNVMNTKINMDPEITHEEMVDEYRQNIKEYEIPAKVRWEQLMVRLDRFNSRDDAWAAIGIMGNQVINAASFAAVARRSSHDFKAQDGGLYDWTSQGSLASQVLEKRLFELPLNKLSERIEDGDAIYIVRVLGRQESSLVPFTEAQVKIKENLKKRKIIAQQAEEKQKLRDSDTYIFTIFDDENKKRTAASGDRVDR